MNVLLLDRFAQEVVEVTKRELQRAVVAFLGRGQGEVTQAAADRADHVGDLGQGGAVRPIELGEELHLDPGAIVIDELDGARGETGEMRAVDAKLTPRCGES